jgi:hypothetical protein
MIEKNKEKRTSGRVTRATVSAARIFIGVTLPVLKVERRLGKEVKGVLLLRCPLVRLVAIVIIHLFFLGFLLGFGLCGCSGCLLLLFLGWCIGVPSSANALEPKIEVRFGWLMMVS